MQRLLSTDVEFFDGPYGVLLHRLRTRRTEIRARFRAIVALLLDGNLTGTSVHSPWNGNRCVPLIDDYVIVFTIEERNEGGEFIRQVFFLSLQVETARH